MTVTDAPTVTVTRKAEVPLSGFRAALTAHTLTAGKDQTLPQLTGVKITVADGRLRMESTDRYRLTVTEQKLDQAGEEEFSVLIFGEDLQRIAKTLPKRGLVVFLSATDAELTVASFDGAVTARLGVVTEFPNLRDIAAEREPSAVERFGINPAYLAALAKMPRDKNAPVVFSLADKKPVRSRWTHEGVEFVHVIMPVRLSD